MPWKLGPQSMVQHKRACACPSETLHSSTMMAQRHHPWSSSLMMHMPHSPSTTCIHVQGVRVGLKKTNRIFKCLLSAFCHFKQEICNSTLTVQQWRFKRAEIFCMDKLLGLDILDIWTFKQDLLYGRSWYLASISWLAPRASEHFLLSAN